MMKAVTILFIFLIITACSTIAPDIPTTKDFTPQKSSNIETTIELSNTWIYQLQNTNFQDLLDADVSYIVVDIDDSSLSKEQISQLQDQGKKVYSYISIGEAEEYRSYWPTLDQSLLSNENPEWEGNYVVKFWRNEWQLIIIQKITAVALQGYNGVYLDRVDVYEEFPDRDNVDDEMVGFVVGISKGVKEYVPNFDVIVQNGLDLLSHQKYFNAIDGVGKEDTWYDENGPLRNTEYEVPLLNKVKNAGKIVLVVDYPTEEHYCTYLEQASFYTSTVGTRELDSIITTSC